jgi:LacI family gluconate utilization system Gnt-I transcriptional repressor
VDSMVGISHTRAGREMAEVILAAGYRKIGFLGSKMPDDHRARKRLEGFTTALNAAGVPLAATEHYAGGSSLAKGREMTESILKHHPDLDFLYYSNDMIGAGGLLYCLDKGLDVPGQIGLAGFNGLELLDGIRLRLATTDACRREIGLRAAEIVAGKSEDGVIGAKRIELSPIVNHGDTIRS